MAATLKITEEHLPGRARPVFSIYSDRRWIATFPKESAANAYVQQLGIVRRRMVGSRG